MEPETLNLPVLALRGLTVFPHTNLTFDVERRISMKALEVAMETGQEIFLVTQREINVEKPAEQDLYVMGTISRVTQILRLGKSSLRVMVEGGRRARLKRLWQTEPYLQGHVELVEEPETGNHGPRTEALLRQTWNLFQDYAQLAGNVAEEVLAAAMDCQEPGALADLIAQNIALRYDDKQAILEELFTELERCSDVRRISRSEGLKIRIEDYIAEHYNTTSFSLSGMAEHFNITASYLSRYFKECFGENFNSYISRYKIEKAKEMLVNTNYAVREISALVGYWDVNNFIKNFKRMEGVTPGQYRANRSK